MLDFTVLTRINYLNKLLVGYKSEKFFVKWEGWQLRTLGKSLARLVQIAFWK